MSMNPKLQSKRSSKPSIMTVFEPVEEYWASFEGLDIQGRPLEEVLNPFDAFLTHLVLEFTPGLPLVVDLAVESTGGASSLIGLTHPHVRGVLAVSDGGTVSAGRTLSALKVYLRSRPAGHAPLDVTSREALASSLVDESRIAILVDAREEDSEDLSQQLQSWTDEYPDALIFVFGLGRVGECRGIEAIQSACSSSSSRRFWLMRELEEVFAGSDLALVARNDHPHLADVLQRIQLLHASNYNYLDLLKSHNQLAMQQARVDDNVFQTHPLSAPLRAEFEALKRSAEESRGRGDELAR
ncbi:hypothetical protein ACYOEI_07415, partial [Singulisphaera rosea]